MISRRKRNYWAMSQPERNCLTNHFQFQHQLKMSSQCLERPMHALPCLPPVSQKHPKRVHIHGLKPEPLHLFHPGFVHPLQDVVLHQCLLLLSCSKWFPPSLLCHLAIFCLVVPLISSLSLAATLCSI